MPHVWCQGNAVDAGSYDATILPDTSAEVVASYPLKGLPDFQRELAGQPLLVDVTVSGYLIPLINAGSEFRPTSALSFILNMNPLFSSAAPSAVPEAEQCGWLVDPCGVSWQIVPQDLAALMQHPGAYQRMLAMKKIVLSEL